MKTLCTALCASLMAFALSGCVVMQTGENAALVHTTKQVDCEQSGAAMEDAAGCTVSGSDVESAMEAALEATVTP